MICVRIFHLKTDIQSTGFCICTLYKSVFSFMQIIIKIPLAFEPDIFICIDGCTLTQKRHLYVTKRLSYHEVNVSLFTAEIIHQSLEAMLLFANLKHSR